MKMKDFIKYSKPTMEELLIESIHDTVEIDKLKPNEDLELVKYENETFYYRAIYLFLQRVQEYYNSDEVEEWLQEKILRK